MHLFEYNNCNWGNNRTLEHLYEEAFMKIGIIIYSKTGHTKSVAETLEQQLKDRGHDVTLDFIEIAEQEKDVMHPEITKAPDASPYDFLIFGAPVQGFRLCAAMSTYLNLLDDMKGKKFACIVTQALPFKWLGGEQASRKMKSIVTDKGGEFIGHSIINWNKADREGRIDDTIKHILRLIEIEVAVEA